jgi:hypothetical protein
MEEITTSAPNTSSDVGLNPIVTPVIPKKRTRKPKEQVLQPLPVTAPVVLKTLGDSIPAPLTPEEKKRLQRDEAEKKLRAEYEIERQMVTGVYRDLEVGAGGYIAFSARKYKWDPVQKFEFHDGCTYTVPLWVAKHLNEGCKFPVYKHNIEPNAKPGEKAKQFVNAWNHRFAFVSSDFMGLHRVEAAPLIMVGNQ